MKHRRATNVRMKKKSRFERNHDDETQGGQKMQSKSRTQEEYEATKKMKSYTSARTLVLTFIPLILAAFVIWRLMLLSFELLERETSLFETVNLQVIVLSRFNMLHKHFKKVWSMQSAHVKDALYNEEEEIPSRHPTPHGGDEDDYVHLYTYDIVREFWHDPTAFTQGLLYHNGSLYESTGLYHATSVRRLDPITGEVTRINRSGDEKLTQRNAQNQQGNFGEGLALVFEGNKFNNVGGAEHDGTLLQLTWKSSVGYAFNLASLEGKYEFTTELKDGWGLASGIPHQSVFGQSNDDDNFILAATDHSTRLYYLDPKTMKTIKTMEVKDGVQAIPMVNELEYFNDHIWGNIFGKECIVVLDPKTARVKAWVDMTGLRKRLIRSEQNGMRIDVLNGIAYDSENDKLFVTGKQWSKMFEIQIREMTEGEIYKSGGYSETLQDLRSRCWPHQIF